MEKIYTFINKYKKRFISMLVILILIVGVTLLSLSKSNDVGKLDTSKQEETNKQDIKVDDKKEDDTNKITDEDRTNKTELSKETTEPETNTKTDNKASNVTKDEETQKTNNTGNSNQGQKPEESNTTPAPSPTPEPTPTPAPTPKPVCEIGENPNLPCEYVDIPAGYQVMDYQKALEEMAKVNANGGGYDGGWLTRNDGQPVYFIRFW